MQQPARLQPTEPTNTHVIIYIDGLVQDCSNSSALAIFENHG